LINQKIAFLGSGHMAGAILRGIVGSGVCLKENLFVINPIDVTGGKTLAEECGIAFKEATDLKEAEIVILGFKPQNLSDALKLYQDGFHAGQTVISILAGVPLAVFEAILPVGVAVIRTMPNLPLAVGKGAVAYCRGKHANDQTAAITEEIFAPLGVIKQVNEEDLDAVTALSGSGPAYIYYLLEAMVEGACREGLDEATALALAKQTLLGSAVLLSQCDETPGAMRKKITSAKGTTEAGLKAMTQNHFYEAMLAGIKAASDRSKEMGKSFLLK